METRENPIMKISSDTSVHSMLKERPDLRWTLVDNGLVPLADEHHVPPPERTIGEAALRHGLDTDALLTALRAAAANLPDDEFVAKMKKKFAGFKGGSCGGH